MRRTFLTSIMALVLGFVAVAQDWDVKMKEYGLVDVTTMCNTFIVDIRYASTNNFVGKNMYGDFTQTYLIKDAAVSLVKAQEALKRIDPDYSLIIYDAARPQSVQQTMWDEVKGTPQQQYVARPAKGGTHNFGVAVDVGLAYKGEPVDMGTEFDCFTEDAHITSERWLVKKGRISEEALKNRQLLRKVMTEAGYKTYRHEWWHFERYRIKYARATFKLLDF